MYLSFWAAIFCFQQPFSLFFGVLLGFFSFFFFGFTWWRVPVAVVSKSKIDLIGLM